MKKFIILSIGVILLLALLNAAFDLGSSHIDEYYTSPDDGFYNIDRDGNVTIICNATPQWNYSIINISLIHNITNPINASADEPSEFTLNDTVVYSLSN